MKTKIYTKGGDLGQTSILGGPRLSKADARLAAYGAIDELNAFIGLAVSTSEVDRISQVLTAAQNQLFVVGSHLACADLQMRSKLPALNASAVSSFEKEIDELSVLLPELREFILPGGALLACQLHVCRTVCRRAEREVVSFLHSTADGSFSAELKAQLVTYLNRFNDYLFMAARYANQQSDTKEMTWQK